MNIFVDLVSIKEGIGPKSLSWGWYLGRFLHREMRGGVDTPLHPCFIGLVYMGSCKPQKLLYDEEKTYGT